MSEAGKERELHLKLAARQPRPIQFTPQDSPEALMARLEVGNSGGGRGNKEALLNFFQEIAQFSRSGTYSGKLPS